MIPVAGSVVSPTSGRSSSPANPCSGENSATRFTPAARIMSILRLPVRSTPVWLVISPTRLPLSAAKPSAASTSRPVSVGALRSTSRCSPASVDGLVVAGERHAGRVDAQRRRRDGRDLAAQAGDGRPAERVHAVRQQDHVRVADWIDPDGRAGEAGVAVRADGEQIAAIAGEWRIDIPAEAAQDGLVGAGFAAW